MNNLFPPELRTASVVRRWSIVRTLHPDTVAEHQFYVCFYALQVARLLNWAGPQADLMYFALMHDVEELVTGDIVSPVKRGIIDEGRYPDFVSAQMAERLPLIERQGDAIMESKHGTEIERIVKVADKIDAVIFLIIEQTMGNGRIGPLLADAMENLVIAWHDLGVELYINDEDRARHQDLWNDQIYPALQAHHKHGGIGIT